MSVIFDQLRISDDGHTMYVDAHVNKSSYFENVYLNRVTICTEEQVSELSPETYSDKYVYRKNFVPSTDCTLESRYDKIQVLTADNLLDNVTEKGGVSISFDSKEEALSSYLSVLFSGDFPQLSTGNTPVMVVAEPSFDPTTEPINSEKVLLKSEGSQIPYGDRNIWQFKGKEDLQGYTSVVVYIYSLDDSGVYLQVPIQSTADKNFLHFYWQVFDLIPHVNQKELHLMLKPQDFNENFSTSDFSHNMFFVYVETVGIPSEDTPCRLDEMTTLGVTFDYGVLYQQAMGYTKELADDCNISKSFVDFILNTEALKLSLETGHYIPAIQLWKKLAGEGNTAVSSGMIKFKPCGCHG